MIGSTKIFLDSGNPADTREILEKLGTIDGQTTNPSLVAKHPKAQEYMASGNVSESQILELYREIIQDMRNQLPKGSISIEVYSDQETTVETMLAQALEMNTWIDNPHIKLPTTSAGLQVAHQLVGQGINVNMTLCFTQQQAMAVHAATLGAKPGQVFVSPFVGRLDDLGQNGVELIENILKHYKAVDSHVSVLAASIRSLEHFYELFCIETPIITVPKPVLTMWVAEGAEMPVEDFSYDPENLAPIPFEEIDYDQGWQAYNLEHELTTSGIEKFAADWKKLFNA
jgi:transaldolase